MYHQMYNVQLKVNVPDKILTKVKILSLRLQYKLIVQLIEKSHRIIVSTLCLESQPLR